MRTDARRRRLIDSHQARKVGRRYWAFYCGYHARRTGQPGNPHTPGTEDHTHWESGWKFATEEEPGHEPASG